MRRKEERRRKKEHKYEDPMPIAHLYVSMEVEEDEWREKERRNTKFMPQMRYEL